MPPVAFPAVAVVDSVVSVAVDSAADLAAVVDSAAMSAVEAADGPPVGRAPPCHRTDSPWSWIHPSDWKQQSRTPWARS